jgi:putative aldouronate transport system permease protein
MYSLAVGFPTPIIFALLLNSVRSKKWKSWIENVTYMPHFISTVVMVGIMMRVFDYYTGVVHNMLAVFGISWNVHMFTGDPNFRNLYIWSGVWQGTGWGSIIYMAALSGVDPELHEAAIVDGATRIRRIWNIDLPSIIPTITITLILRCGSIMSIGFDKVFLMQNTLNKQSSEVISTYVYHLMAPTTGAPQFSLATAVGLFTNVVNFVFLMLTNAISKRVTGSGLM